MKKISMHSVTSLVVSFTYLLFINGNNIEYILKLCINDSIMSYQAYQYGLQLAYNMSRKKHSFKNVVILLCVLLPL